MLFKSKFFLALVIVLTLSFSVLAVGPAYADGDTPNVEPTATEQPVDGTDTTDGGEPPVVSTEEPPLVEEVLPTSEPVVIEEEATVEPLLAELPEGTELVVLNEEGESVSLASQEAANAIVVGDPVWCPATVASPTPGLNGCSASHATFASLLTDPVFLAGGKDGIIWIASNYNGADASTININGSSLTNLANFKLTLQGGWCDGTDVTCVGLIDTSKPSTFDVRINITNWNADVTLKNITIQGVTSTGLVVTTTKNIVLTNVKSNSNSVAGADLGTNVTNGVGNITVTQSQFNSNGNVGLNINSKGTVTLTDVTASANASWGVLIDNDIVTNKPIIFSGTNVFTSNGNDGVNIQTASNVTLNNITADSNTGDGVEINSTVNVTLTGSNFFNNNTNNGLRIATNSNINLNNIAANSNGSYGANLTTSGAAGSIKLTGTNQFTFNGNIGLYIYTNSAITGNNITASSNTGYGAYFDNSSNSFVQPVTLTGSNSFNTNTSYGLYVYTLGAVSLNSVQANGNNNTNVYITNNFFGSTGGVTLSGTNQFNSSVTGSGLYIDSRGVVTLSNITANGNSIRGVYVDTTYAIAPRAVTLSGTNSVNGNGQVGVYITASGAITVSNLTASNNLAAHGAYLSNVWKINQPQSVTLTGTNVFDANALAGLYINSYGTVTANNLSANGNGTLMTYEGYGVYISNSSSAITPYNVTLTGINTFNSNYQTNLYISSDGVISVSNLTANSSSVGSGAYLNNNNNNGSTGGVVLSGTNSLNTNQQGNLQIYTNGTVTINNLTANGSVSGAGAYISAGLSTPRAINITGTNVFNNNYYDGLSVYGTGSITLNNITANGNGTSATSGNGVSAGNTNLPSPAKISLTGTNTFNLNFSDGLSINSSGMIATNNLNASLNNNYGVSLNNSYYAGYSSITMTGTNVLSTNGYDNLYISANGPVSVSNLSSNASSGTGANIYNNYDAAKPQSVSFLGTNSFTNNRYQGLYIQSYGAISLSNITATGNGTGGSYSGVHVDNYNFGSAFIPNAITLTGTHVFSNNTRMGLEVRSLGNITLGSVTTTANNNNNNGISLLNNYQGATGNVTITGSVNVGNNALTNLVIQSYGNITTNNLTSTNSVSGSGVSINNVGKQPKTVTVNGTNVFNGNFQLGLTISSLGAVTTNNLTANSNGAQGVQIDNSNAVPAAAVTLNGTNAFSGNGSDGLYINSKGAVTTNSLSSTSNTGNGVYIYNQYTGSTGSVTIKGTNTFTGNAIFGLDVESMGAVTLNNVTASTNGTKGAYISNNAAATAVGVTLTGVNTFSSNVSGSGLEIYTKGTITTNGITANNNGSYGAYFNGNAAKIMIGGTNAFNSNSNTGLYVTSSGIITMNNITANNSTAGAGLYALNNGGGTMATITLTGVNTFNGNKTNGLNISSGGVVTMTKVTADFNGTTTTSSGMSISAGGNINITCTSFSNNGQNGIRFNSFNFVATLTGVDLLGNTSAPTFINGGSGSVVTVAGCPLP